MTDDGQEQSTFSFGEYVSPNPKPIPLGRFKPEPSVRYQIKKTVKYDNENENKEQSEVFSERADSEESGTLNRSIESAESMDFVQKNFANVSFQEPCTAGNPIKTSPKRRQPIPQPTPAKIKVQKQAKEIEFLQRELRRLQFENEKLKSRSQSPQNEENLDSGISITGTTRTTRGSEEHQSHQSSDSGHISFNPSVDIVSATATMKNTSLHDKVSLVRSQRNATPYKSKSDRPSRVSGTCGTSGRLESNNSNRSVESMKEIKKMSATAAVRGVKPREKTTKKFKGTTKGNKCSRNRYRVTPIPVNNKRKSTKFKSKLNSIQQSEKENQNCSNFALDETAPTPKDMGKLKKYPTPSYGDKVMERNQRMKQREMPEMGKSFDFGREVLDTPSEASSFIRSNSLGSSFMKDETPEFMNQKLVGQGKGASKTTTPILTPMRGKTPPDSKPFSFDWNKK